MLLLLPSRRILLAPRGQLPAHDGPVVRARPQRRGASVCRQRGGAAHVVRRGGAVRGARRPQRRTQHARRLYSRHRPAACSSPTRTTPEGGECAVAVPEDMLATYRALRTAHVLAANAARAVRQRAASLWSPAPPKTVTVAKGCPSHPNNTPDGNSGVADGVRESPGGVSLVVSPRRWRGSVQTLHVRASTGQPPPSSPHCTRVSARFPRVLCRLTARGRAHAVHAGSLHQNPPAT